MNKISYLEDLFVIENFLSDSECNDLINQSEKIGYEEAMVQTGENSQSLLKSVRNNDRILYKNTHLADKFFKLSEHFLIQKFEEYQIAGLNEMFRFYRYSPKQRFKMHRDGSFKRNENEKSLFTFLIYLNDDFEGGETEFKDIITVKPKKGTLIIFNHSYKHEGKVIIKGVKYALRSDVMYSNKNINSNYNKL